MSESTERAIKKDNQDKPVTQGTQEEEKQNKNITQHVLDTKYQHTVNKTCALPQTAGGKDEPIIVFMRKL